MPLQSLLNLKARQCLWAECQFQYHWRANRAAQLPMAICRKNIGSATGISYTRINAQFGNAGSYDVIVTNSFGSITSAVACLKRRE